MYPQRIRRSRALFLARSLPFRRDRCSVSTGLVPAKSKSPTDALWNYWTSSHKIKILRYIYPTACQAIAKCFIEVQHPQGCGRITHAKCDVRFHWLIPKDLGQCPYYLFLSAGEHKHPPPPPGKTPSRILQGVYELIKSTRDPALTTSQSYLRLTTYTGHWLPYFVRQVLA